MSVSSGFSIVVALRIHPIGGYGHIRQPHGLPQRYIEFRDAAAKVDPTSHMEKAAMSDLEKFRRETRAWLEANCPPEMRRPMTSEEDTFWGGRNTKFASKPQQGWFERKGDKGWTVPHWPKEYSGGGPPTDHAKNVHPDRQALRARQH